MTEIHRLLVLAGAAVADLDELPKQVTSVLDAAEEVLSSRRRCQLGSSG